MNRLAIRQLAEVLSDTDGHDFPTTAQKDSLVSEEARRLYAEALNLPTFPAKRTRVTLAVTGAGSYPLAVAALSRVLQVQWTGHSGLAPTILAKASDSHRNRVLSTVPHQLFQANATTWDIEMDPLTGANLLLFPPLTSGTIYVDVLAGHPGLASDSTEYHMPDPCGRLVAVRAAMRFVEKADKDPRVVASLAQEQAKLEAEAFLACGALGGGVTMADYAEYTNDGYA